MKSAVKISLFVLLSLGVIKASTDNKKDEGESEETYEETRVNLCKMLAENGMDAKFDNCYDTYSPKEIKDIDSECAKVIGIQKLESYKILRTKFCVEPTGKEVFEKFEMCADDKAEKQNMDEKKEEELLKPVFWPSLV